MNILSTQFFKTTVHTLRKATALIAFLALTQFCFASPQGAKIDESVISTVLYVDKYSETATDGMDNPGTDPERPLKSFKRAAGIAIPLLNKGTNVKIKLASGVYREQVRIDDQWTPEGIRALLVIEGDEKMQTILKGTITEGFEAETWTPVPGHPNIYSHSWDQDLGVVAGPWANIFDDHDTLIRGVAQRGELLVVNDRILEQKLLEEYLWIDPDGAAGINEDGIIHKDNKDGTLQYQGLSEKGLDVLDSPWTFAVADHPDSDSDLRDRIFMKVPEGYRLQETDKIEVGAPREPFLDWPANREWGFHYLPSPLFIANKDNVVIRNLVIRHGSTHLLGAACHLWDVSNALIEDCVISDNNGIGLSVTGRGKPHNVTVRRCRLNNNGYAGLRPPGRQSLVEDVEVCFNNWRGDWGGFNGVDASGMKVGRANQTTFRRCVAIGNRTHGFWDDVYSKGVSFEKCLAYANYDHGFFIELSGSDNSVGDGRISHSVSVANGRSGYQILEYRRPSLTHSISALNKETQLKILDYKSRAPNGADDVEAIQVGNCWFISDGETPLVLVHEFQENILLPAFDFTGNAYSSIDKYILFRQGSETFTSLEEWAARVNSSGGTETKGRVRELSSDWDAESILSDPKSPVLSRAVEMGIPLPKEHIDRAAHEIQSRKTKQASLMDQALNSDSWRLAEGTDRTDYKILNLDTVDQSLPMNEFEAIGLDPQWYNHLNSIYGVTVNIHSIRGSTLKLTLQDEKGGATDPIVFDVHDHLKAIYFLHAATGSREKEILATYTINYADGKSHSVDILSAGVPWKRDPFAQPLVQDWNFEPALLNSSLKPVPASIKNPMKLSTRSLYMLELVNPSPEKEVQSISMKTDNPGPAELYVFAVSLLLGSD